MGWSIKLMCNICYSSRYYLTFSSDLLHSPVAGLSAWTTLPDLSIFYLAASLFCLIACTVPDCCGLFGNSEVIEARENLPVVNGVTQGSIMLPALLCRPIQCSTDTNLGSMISYKAYLSCHKCGIPNDTVL